MKTNTLGSLNDFTQENIIGSQIWQYMPTTDKDSKGKRIYLGNEFGLDPERSHTIAMLTSKYAEKSDWVLDQIRKATYVSGEENLGVDIGDLHLPNPVGLAAGFCKEPLGLKFWEAFGFGSITVGGMGEHAQLGNIKPRIFREDGWIRNAVGLPWESLRDREKALQYRVDANMMPSIPLGANLCNSAKLNEEKDPEKLLRLKIEEYKTQMTALYPYFDYFEINISCPNQAGGCSLASDLDMILKELTKHNSDLAFKNGVSKKKLFVKISPLTQDPENPRDGTIEGLHSLADVCNQYSDDGVHAIVATNTAQEHPKMDAKDIYSPSMDAYISGGASGKEVQETSRRTVTELRKVLDPEIPIIGVGGIGYDEPGYEGGSAVNMIDAGADSLQLYTSFVNKSVLTPMYAKQALLEENSNK